MGCFHSTPVVEECEGVEPPIDIHFSNTSTDGKERNTRASSRPSRARHSGEPGAQSASAFIAGRHGSSRGVPSPSLSSVSLVPVARTGSYDVRVASRTRQNGGEGVIETSRLVVDHLKGNVFINQYLIIKDLGKGAHGTVKLVYNTHDEMLYAMKVIHKRRMRRQSYLAEPRAVANMMRNVSPLSPMGGSQTEGHRGLSPLASPRTPGAITDEYSNEIAVMKELDHPNLVKLYEVIHDPSNNKLLMLMEYVEGGCVLAGNSPTQKVPIPELTAVKYFRDVVKGLEYLHFNRIVHGDLKPDNLLMSSSGKVKISDFGSARFCEKSDMIFATAGTPTFMAPEMCQGKQFNGFPGDIWALGVCLFMFVFGRPPFTGGTTYQIYENIQNSELHFPPEIPVSRELMDLLVSLMQKDPSNRLSLEEIPTHPWVTRGGALPVLQTSNERAVQRVFEAMRKRNESGGPKRPAPSTVPLAVPLEPVDMRKLVPDAEVRTYKDGEVIIAQGTVPEGLFYIQDGFVDLLMMPSEKKLVADEDFADAISDDDEDEDEAEAVNAVASVLDGRRTNESAEGGTEEGSGGEEGDEEDEDGNDGEGGQRMDDFMALFGARLSDRISPLGSSRTVTPRNHSASITPRHASHTLAARMHSTSVTPRHASQSLSARPGGPPFPHSSPLGDHRTGSMPLPPAYDSPSAAGHMSPGHHHPHHHPHHSHHPHHHPPYRPHSPATSGTASMHSRSPSHSMPIGQHVMGSGQMGTSMSTTPRMHSASLSPRHPLAATSGPAVGSASGNSMHTQQALNNVASRLSFNGSNMHLRGPSYSGGGIGGGALSAGGAPLSPSPLGLSCSNAMGAHHAFDPDGARMPRLPGGASTGGEEEENMEEPTASLRPEEMEPAPAAARSEAPQSPFQLSTSKRQLAQEPSFNPRQQRLDSGQRAPSRLGSTDAHGPLSTSAQSGKASLLGRAASNRASPRNSEDHPDGLPREGTPSRRNASGLGPGGPGSNSSPHAPLPPLPPGHSPSSNHPYHHPHHPPHTPPATPPDPDLQLTPTETRRASITAGSTSGKRLGMGALGSLGHAGGGVLGAAASGTGSASPASGLSRNHSAEVAARQALNDALDSCVSESAASNDSGRKGSNDSIISNADISMQASTKAGWRRERPAPVLVTGAGSGLGGGVAASPPGLVAMPPQHRLAGARPGLRRAITNDLAGGSHHGGGAVMTSAGGRWMNTGQEEEEEVGEEHEGGGETGYEGDRTSAETPGEGGPHHRHPHHPHGNGSDPDMYGHMASAQPLGRLKTPTDRIKDGRVRRHSTSSYNATSMLTRILGVSCSGAPLDRSSIQEWSSTSKLAQKAIQRSDSMHSRMAQMVLRAKQHAVRRRRRGSMQLITTRGPGSVVGELCIDSKANPSPSTVVAKGVTTLLLIKNEKINKYRNQPSVMAALHRSQNASLVQEAMERFVECEQEVVAVEVIRRTITTEPNMHLDIPNQDGYTQQELYGMGGPEQYMADIYNA